MNNSWRGSRVQLLSVTVSPARCSSPHPVIPLALAGEGACQPAVGPLPVLLLCTGNSSVMAKMVLTFLSAKHTICCLFVRPFVCCNIEKSEENSTLKAPLKSFSTLDQDDQDQDDVGDLEDINNLDECSFADD